MRDPRFVTRGLLLVVVAVAALGALRWYFVPPGGGGPVFAGLERVALAAEAQRAADPFDGGTAWFNTGPLKLKDLKGKVVLLDFWTYCCINCHHVIPVLAQLEEKYKDELVVIGVHTPKFPAEQDGKNIRNKIIEYRVKHPVVNDANMTIWNGFGVSAWPTLILLGPDGQEIARQGGEIPFAVLDKAIAQVVAQAKATNTLDTTPVKFFPENEKADDTPLLFPGKVLADAQGKRLFIADTGHSRLVITDLEGKSPITVGNGKSGLVDGPFDKAEFNRPQGMTLVGDVLYVADTENHAIRAVDLKKKTVTTVAGTGKQGSDRKPAGPAKATALSSPWDLASLPGTSRVLYIAMAGPHQIWRLDLETGHINVFAGTGRENIVDGPADEANFAQPSGLATDGTHLFVADSEVSGIRQVGLGAGRHLVKTIVGEGLFEFGDIDGSGAKVRLQHCLGVAFNDGTLYIADTYNNKIKVCDPKSRAVKTFLGDGKPGKIDDPAEFYQPGGLSIAGNTLFVADTNNHAIRVVDLATKTVSTLAIEGISPPKPRAGKPHFLNATVKSLPKATVAPGKDLTLDVSLPIPPGYKLNDGAMAYDVVSPDQPSLIDPEFAATGGRLEKSAKQFTVAVPLARATTAGETFALKVSVQALVCSEGSNFCKIKSFVWNVPVAIAADGAGELTIAK